MLGRVEIGDQTCSGTIHWLAIAGKLAACALSKFSTTVLASGVSMLVGTGAPPVLVALSLLNSSKVDLTSAEVNAWPSLHLVPGASWKVAVLLPLDHA